VNHGFVLENVERCGATAVMVADDWGKGVDLDKIKKAIAANAKVKAIAFVHAETSTGAEQPLAEIVKVAHDAGAVIIVDAVTSLGGVPLQVDALDIDVCYSGSRIHER